MIGAGGEWITFISVGGTLLGVAIGSYATYKIQERQLYHADVTRFHELRLEVYTRYLATINQEFSLALFGRRDAEAVQRRVDCFEQIRLVCSDNLLVRTNELHNLMLTVDSAADRRKKAEQLKDQINRAVAAFANDARAELHIDKLTPRRKVTLVQKVKRWLGSNSGA